MKLGPQDVQSLYRHRFSEKAQKSKDRIWKVLVSTWFQKWVRPTDTVLDLGCGYGEFLNHLRAAKRIGRDLNPDGASLLASDVEFRPGDVCDLTEFEDNSIDVVFSSNLLEHLPTKEHVNRLLKEAHRVLRPSGHLILMGPNVRFLPGVYWDFWDHHVPISDRSLREALSILAFDIIDLYPRFLPYTTCSRFPQSPSLVWLYLKCRPAWFFLGKQFLLRARKS